MRLAALVGAGLLLFGCASPNPRYYTLERAPGPVLRGLRQVVVVQGPPVPRYLERYEIVRRSEGGRVRVSDNDWWSETLRTMVPRVLAADLAQRLPDAEVIGTEAFGSGGLGVESATVILSVDRFEPQGDGSVALDGHLGIQVGGRDRLLRRIAVSVALPGGGADDQVRAMSVALGQAADMAAAALAQRSF